MAASNRIDWEHAAARLAEILPRERLHPAVLAWSATRSRREKWAVAFSGGADSLTSLLLLWAHWPEHRRSLVALHFDHRLRGRESRADAAFCRKVATALGLKFEMAAWMRRSRDVSEADARAARLAFFASRSRVLWLGHQQDDIAESMLMRLARGSGAGGLAAPRPVQPMPGGRIHLRPLLTLKKAEVVGALKSAGCAWREDATNGQPLFFRNRVRREVIPAWVAAAQRDALTGAARSRELLAEDDTALEAWLGELDPWNKQGGLLLERLAGKPRALMRRALHEWLLKEPRAGELVSRGFEALLDAAVLGQPTRRSLGNAGFAVIRRGVLSFVPTGKRNAKFQRRAN
jgi:tRNA(Ile)-lysidine synthase